LAGASHVAAAITKETVTGNSHIHYKLKKNTTHYVISTTITYGEMSLIFLPFNAVYDITFHEGQY
jgi:hypothetical protein